MHLKDGRWVDGWLEAYRKDDDGWRGWVRYTTGLAETRMRWFTEDHIRATDASMEP